MNRQCEIWQKHARAHGGIPPDPGGVRKNRKWCDGIHSGGLPAATQISHPAETGLDNSGSAIRGFKD
jgi:hypothetical protein